MRNGDTASKQSIENRFSKGQLNLLPIPINHSHWLTIQYIGPGRFGDSRNLSDEIWRHIQLGEALSKNFDNRIEVGIIEATLHEMGVGTTHVLPRVVNRPAKGHGEKGFLLGDLVIHIDALKKVADTVIGENLSVEDINSSFDGGCSAQLFV